MDRDGDSLTGDRDGDSLNCAIFWPLPGRLAIGGSLNRAIFCPFPA